ncbi:unnamed protein product [Schistosoma rodhaini]|uniref:Uncharacterized protein n=1 Tax=Schistosoma rodhaini TaxID=6188 RepID=A0AA85FZG8_9TREM|nr:unnamed protein product [Schistosoma rodhaini]
MNDNQLTSATTTTTTSNNTTDKTTYKQNITQLKLTSSSSASSYTTNKELEQSFNNQQSIMNTTQFLRQRVTEHLIEFLNWFVLSQVSYVIKEETIEMSVIELTCLTYSI